LIENPLIGLASILVLGTLAQWLAWRLRLPSILLLLLTGFVVGPVTGILHPDTLLGDLVFPIVSLSVAVIIFEGGLTLDLAELRDVGMVVRRIISIGTLVTWILGAVAAYFILDIPVTIALLLGAILTVSGPTVVIPLLRHVRPTARVSSTLKWEGILIDPVGATLAVLVFEAIIAGQGVEYLPLAVAGGIIKALVVGIVVGLVGAGLIYFPLRRYWVPDTLQNPLTLMLVVAAFVVANLLQEEAGLLAVTVMGIALANQRKINVRNIIRFKENLVLLLLSSVFIILAARLQLSDLSQLGPSSLLFLVVLILIVRPLAVLASSIGSELNWRERAFVAALAPRGIVAAAVSAIFALELSHLDFEQAEVLVPITFLVIVGTVSVYSLSATFIANRLGIAQADPQGILFVGAHSWARRMAEVLHNSGRRVLLVDSNWNNIQEARMMGLPVHFGSILSEDIIDELNLNGIGRILALTSNDEVNSLSNLHFAEVFDSSGTYQLSPSTRSRRDDLSLELHGRYTFGRDVTFTSLFKMFNNGAEIRSTPITDKFTFNDLKSQNKALLIPLFLLSKDGQVDIFTVDHQLEPIPGQTVISVVGNEHVSTVPTPSTKVDNAV